MGFHFSPCIGSVLLCMICSWKLTQGEGTRLPCVPGYVWAPGLQLQHQWASLSDDASHSWAGGCLPHPFGSSGREGQVPTANAQVLDHTGAVLLPPADWCLRVTHLHGQTCAVSLVQRNKPPLLACGVLLPAGLCCRQDNPLVHLQLCIKLPFTHQSELITPLKYEKVYQLPPEFSAFILVLAFTKENKLQL